MRHQTGLQHIGINHTTTGPFNIDLRESADFFAIVFHATLGGRFRWDGMTLNNCCRCRCPGQPKKSRALEVVCFCSPP